MRSEPDVLALVSSIYDASLDPCLWSQVLGRICDTLGANSGLMLRHGSLYPAGQVLASANIDLSYQLSYQQYFGPRNVWLSAARGAVQDRARTSEMMLPVSELMKSEFYRNFLRPQNVLHTVAACIQSDPRSMPVCVMFRSPKDGPFGQPHMDLLTQLTPHMRRALQLQERTAGLQAQSEAAMGALDALPIGCLLVDRQSRVLAANRTGEEILKAEDGLSAWWGVLKASRVDDEERLRYLIRSAAEPLDGRGLGSGGALKLARSSGRAALHVLVIPHRGGGDLSGPKPAAVVFVSDPERKARPDHEVLASVFGLTPGESRVAGALLKGLSIEECALELAISRHTARNHLKAIFSKTDTTRQGELVGRLLSSVTRLETGH
jgi:DNA-binding CsgD family transcriptional regulator/PAS domain-containing protein